MTGKVLVAGGAGYIGAHTAMALEASGCELLVFDNLSSGHRDFLRFGRHVIGDLGNRAALEQLFAAGDIGAVLHFAACASVGESVADPAKYYRNNVVNTLNLLEAVREHGPCPVIFSSSCAVYGEPEQLPLREDHPLRPVSPYGRTKLAVEWMLQDFAAAHGLRYCSLRYFNAAGAAPLGAGIGEFHDPETHLIPLALRAALNPSLSLRLFGADYATRDGTCVRDYIHVQDLAQAHILALERLLAGEPSAVFNLGNGRGHTVREVIACAEKVSGLPIRVAQAPRRPGDPDTLVADAAKALAELGWKPQHADLEDIVASAWNWEKSLAGV
jgi:UDP-glucose 4-epimerase